MLMQLLALLTLTVVKADNYAILVAGSMGWYNYRHQADISHAYHTLTTSGHFEPKNVIMMMEDDIANNPQNKHKGTIINHLNGTNVYPGSDAIDFKGKDANKQVLLGMMNGTVPIPGKTFKPTKDDNIFFYYTDHGAVGLVGMPVGEPMYATELLGAFEYLHKNIMYNEMVVYIEACESGSMLQNLSADWNIFGTTAATGDESSYATYWDEDIGVYLGDEYSVAWMEDTDKDFGTENRESLQKQFKNVESVVKQSHPQEFGSKVIRVEDIKNFQTENKGPFQESMVTIISQMRNKKRKVHNRKKESSAGELEIVEVSDSRDVVLNTLQNRLLSAQSTAKYWEISKLIFKEKQRRQETKLVFTGLVVKFVQDIVNLEKFMNTLMVKNIDYDCLPVLYRSYEEACGGWTDHALKYVKVLVNLCGIESVENIAAGLKQMCSRNS